ncbi:MAG: alpha/beta hydrolase [Gammaproteobacteria bacterium]|nr:alpha/beta hydrolase [Gammaproteobacteria bacterium]
MHLTTRHTPLSEGTIGSGAGGLLSESDNSTDSERERPPSQNTPEKYRTLFSGFFSEKKFPNIAIRTINYSGEKIKSPFFESIISKAMHQTLRSPPTEPEANYRGALKFSSPRLLGSGLHKTVIFIPGNGFIAREHLTSLFAADLASKQPWQIFVINARLAPEHQHPAPLNDTLELIQQLINDPKQNIDPEKIVIMGYSSGGGFAIHATLMLIERGIRPKEVILFSPFLSHDFSSIKAIRMLDHDLSSPQGFVKQISNWYLNPEWETNKERALSHEDSLANPLYLPGEDLSKLPRVMIYLGEHDYVKSHIEEFSNKLRKLKVPFFTHCISDPSNSGHGLLWRCKDELCELTIFRLKKLEDTPKLPSSPWKSIASRSRSSSPTTNTHSDLYNVAILPKCSTPPLSITTPCHGK